MEVSVGDRRGKQMAPQAGMCYDQLAGPCFGLCEVRTRETWLPELGLLKRKRSLPSTPRQLGTLQSMAQDLGDRGREEHLE